MFKEPILVIMAAGIGSRYGAGVKQLAKVGPSGEIIMDYSLFDAREAGFKKVVFIIRRSLEKDFREIIGSRIEKLMDVSYAFQEIGNLPDGFVCPAERAKPWGTGHAILAAKDAIDAPFAVINADDYYGKTAFRLLYDFLVKVQEEPQEGPAHFAMAGFVVKNTLSDNGDVTRGICLQDAEGHLQEVHETKAISRRADGCVRGVFEEEEVEIDPEGLVSMNFWGFTEAILDELESGFPLFLTAALKKNPLKEEYLLPSIVDSMLKSGKATVDVLPTPDTWFGITYLEDRASVTAEFAAMAKSGFYPDPLVKEEN
ncbi:MAG: nucleotidyltransferase [Lachnospiraceae bacterium]|nr:nucleotidyltransferase [Lachnospiraceae bacterium]